MKQWVDVTLTASAEQRRTLSLHSRLCLQNPAGGGGGGGEGECKRDDKRKHLSYCKYLIVVDIHESNGEFGLQVLKAQQGWSGAASHKLEERGGERREEGAET